MRLFGVSVVGAASCLSVLSACRSLDATSHSRAASSSPASDTRVGPCEEAGGTLSSLVDCGDADRCQEAINDEQVRKTLPLFEMCQIDHSFIGAETFLKARKRIETAAVTKFLARKDFVPNHDANQPADYHCINEQQGQLHWYLHPPAYGEVIFCEFASDGSSIADWTLYYGSSGPGQAKMAAVLTDFLKPVSVE